MGVTWVVPLFSSLLLDLVDMTQLLEVCIVSLGLSLIRFLTTEISRSW